MCLIQQKRRSVSTALNNLIATSSLVMLNVLDLSGHFVLNTLTLIDGNDASRRKYLGINFFLSSALHFKSLFQQLW